MFFCGFLFPYMWILPNIHRYDAAHRIPLEKWPYFNGNSMQCIEFQYTTQKFDAVHQIFMCNTKTSCNEIEIELKTYIEFIELKYQSNYRGYWESIFRESLRNLLNLAKINTWWVSCPCSFSLESKSCRKWENYMRKSSALELSWYL